MAWNRAILTRSLWIIRRPVNTYQQRRTPIQPRRSASLPRWYNTATLTGSNLDQAFLDPAIHTPLVRQYNINIQYEFAAQWILEVGYVGSSGINLVDTYHEYNIAESGESQRSDQRA